MPPLPHLDTEEEHEKDASPTARTKAKDGSRAVHDYRHCGGGRGFGRRKMGFGEEGYDMWVPLGIDVERKKACVFWSCKNTTSCVSPKSIKYIENDVVHTNLEL